MQRTEPQSVASDDLLTTREALDVLGYSTPGLISRYVAAGKLTPAKKLPGARGAYLFHRSDVERLRDAQRAEIEARRQEMLDAAERLRQRLAASA